MDLSIGRLHTPSTTSTSVAVERCALHLAARLTARGLGPGDRVLLRADNSPDSLAALLALMHLDASIVLLDVREAADQWRRVASISGAHWRLTTAGPDPEPSPGGLVVEDLLAEDLGGSTVGTVLAFGPWSARVDAVVTWSRLSGSRARGTVRTGRCVLGALDRLQDRSPLRGADVLLPLLPVSQVSGLTLLLLAWSRGSSVALAPVGCRLEPAARLAGSTGATVVAAGPATYAALLDLVSRRPELRSDLRTVRSWRCAGEPPAELADRFLAVFGRALVVADDEEPGVGGDGLDTGAWVLHEDPPDRPVPPQRGTALRDLLFAVRDDPATLERILDRAGPSDDPFDGLEAGVDALASALLDEVEGLLRAAAGLVGAGVHR